MERETTKRKRIGSRRSARPLQRVATPTTAAVAEERMKTTKDRRLSFKITGEDLGGRVGRLPVGGRRGTPPCLRPGVHPVHQITPASDLRTMGFEAVMTNSMILYKREKDEGKARGIRSILGFDGLVMTDSGGYQVLEYGGGECDNK